MYDQQLSTISHGSKTVQLKSRIADTLSYFIAHADELVSKQQLMEGVWETIVSDNAITRVIARLRKALGDDPHNPQYIITIQRKGYRLAAPCQIIDSPVEESGVTQNTQRRIFARGAFLFTLLMAVLLLAWQLKGPESGSLRIAEIKPLTSLRGDETDPAITSDGRILAFAHRPINEGWWNIYIKHLESGEVIQVTDSQYNDRLPSWSYDNTQLIFKRVSKNHCEIYAIQFSASYSKSAEQKLMNCDASALYSGVIWGTDNETIYFAESVSVEEPMRIFRKNLYTDNTTQLTSPPDSGRGDYRFSLSPDGKCLAFLRNLNVQGGTELWCYELETNEVSLLHRFQNRVLYLAWESDSKSIIISVGDGQLSQVDINTGILKSITNSLTPLFYPASGGDVLVAASGSLYNKEIWKLTGNLAASPPQVDSSELWIASSQSDYLPRINPSDQSIAFISSRSGIPQIWIKSTDREYQLTQFEQEYAIRSMEWSPDGKQLVVSANSHICWIELETGSFTFGPESLTDIANPVWSYNGEEILFALREYGEWQIFAYHLNSQEIRQVTRKGGYYIHGINDKGFYLSKNHIPGIYLVTDGVAAPAFSGNNSLDKESILGNWRIGNQPRSIYYIPSTYESRLIRQGLQNDIQPHTLLDIGQDILLDIEVSADQQSLYYSRFRKDETDIVSVNR